MANLTAERNLELLNRLGEVCAVVIEGDYSYVQRQIIEFDYSRIGAAGDWYLSTTEHNLASNAGYTTTLTLKK